MKLKAILAVAWAFLAMLVWTFSEWRSSTYGTILEFAIDGYDPRDLLAGHYVQYRVDYGSHPTCEAQYGEHCVCLQISKGLARAESTKLCDAKPAPDCELKIRGYCEYGTRFDAGIDRFYIPESYSQYLATIPENSRIKVRLGTSGRAKVVELLPGGKSLKEYIEIAKVTKPAP